MEKTVFFLILAFPPPPLNGLSSAHLNPGGSKIPEKKDMASSGDTVWAVFEYDAGQYFRDFRGAFSTRDEAIAWVVEDNKYSSNFTQVTHKEWQCGGGIGRVGIKKYILDADKFAERRRHAAGKLISRPIDGSGSD